MQGFEQEIAEILNKAEVLFDLSEALAKYYYSEELEKETLTITLKHGDDSLIASCMRKYENRYHFLKYYWIEAEKLENQTGQQTSKPTCPHGVVEVLKKAALMFDLYKVLQKSGLVAEESKQFMFEVKRGNKVLGVALMKCPCFPGAKFCC